jgi:leucyl/phenylalanyl-tRNA--protein transferase
MPHPEDHLPEHCGEVVFVQPEMRSIFPLGDLRQQKELMRTIRSKRWSYTWNSSFAQVMDLCSNREDTWINDDFKAVYKKLNSLGHAHSIEVWQEKTLVGGLYGVQIGAAFFAESMVSVQTSGSKAALFFLHGHLLCGGFELLETQFVTEHLTFMGARNLSEKEYKPLLGKAVQGSAYFDKQQQSTICG